MLLKHIFIFASLSLLYSQDICIGYDKSTNLCQECPLNYYLSKGLSKGNLVNFSSDCQLKNSNDVLYKKSFYVWNKTCNGACIGTKDQPFDSLISALIFIHNTDLAEKYIEQDIEIKLLGTAHYVKQIDLIYDDMRFFRRMNASVKIGPVFCEEEFILGCVFKLRLDVIELILKTDSFSFEISGNFTFFNIKILGNDIYLPTTSINSCYSSNEICCNSAKTNQSYLNDNCGLINRTLNMNDKSKMVRIKGLFNLRVLFDSDNSKYSRNPSINLKNINVMNFYSLKMEAGWLSFIMINNMVFNINSDNLIIEDSFFPYGYFFSLSLEDDPYYNYLNIDQTKALYSLYAQSSNFISTVTLNNSIFRNYNFYKIKLLNTSTGNFEDSLIVMSNQQNNETYINLENININNIILDTPLYLISNKQTSILFVQISIKMKKISLTFTQNLLFVELFYSYFTGEMIYLDNNKFGDNTVFYLISTKTKISYSTFSNLQLSATQYFIFTQNQELLIEKSFLVNLNGIFLSSSKGRIIFSNDTLSSITINKGYFWSDFSDSSLILGETNFLTFNNTLPSVILFHFFSTSSINISCNGVIFQNLKTYKIFQLESYVTLTYLNFTRVKLIKTEGFISASGFSSFMFLDCNVGSFDSLIVDYFEGIDIKHFTFLFMLAYFNRMVYSNVILQNLFKVDYYTFGILPISGATNIYNEMILDNFTMKNIFYQRFLDINYVGNFGFLTIRNSNFVNITYDRAIVDNKVRNQIFYLQNLKSFVLDNSYINYEENTFFVSFFTLNSAINVTVKNCIMQGKFDNTRKSIPGLNSKNFQFFTFINNTIMNLSSTTSPLDIIDENGVICALASGGYFSSNILSTVIIINNYFFGNIGRKYGVLSIVGANTVYMENNTFMHSTAYYGGALSFYSIVSLQINNLVIDSAKGVEGGGVYIYHITGGLNFSNCFFKQLTAENNGAGILILQVNQGVFDNMECQNSKASQNGGFVSITKSFKIKFSRIVMESLTSYTGGVFYIENSEIEIYLGYTKNTSVESSGGVIFITGSESIVMLENFEISNCFAISEGGFLSSTNIQNLTLLDINVSDSKVKEGGNGIINLLGFLIGDDNVGTFILKNIQCKNNIASFGACLYYSSNNLLFLSNFLSFNNSGSIFNVESDDVVELNFDYVSFINSNEILIKENVISASNPLIVFINVNVKLSFWNVENNTAESFLIKISSSYMTLLNSVFKNYFNIKSTSTNYVRFFSISDSIIKITNITMFYTTDALENTKKLCMFFDGRGVFISITQSLFYNNTNLDLATFNFEDSEISLIESTFLFLSGNVAAIVIKTGNLNIKGCIFKQNVNTLGSVNDDDSSDINFADDDINSAILSIEDSTFIVNRMNSIVIKKASDIFIRNCSFKNIANKIIENSFVRAIYLQDNEQFKIKSCVFTNFIASSGAAMIFYEIASNEIINNIQIESCIFENNTGNFGSVVYLLGSIKINIENSYFVNNKANKTSSLMKLLYEDTGKGACIIADCEYYPKFSMNISNSTFINNTAEKMSPTILCKSPNSTYCFESKNNVFFNNTDAINFTKEFSSSPIKSHFLSSNFSNNIYLDYIKRFSSDNKLIVENLLQNYEVSNYSIVSGQPFDFSMLITDYFDQLLLFESKTSATLNCFYNNRSNSTSFNQVVFVDKGSTQALNGIFNFQGVKIIFIPNNTLDCQINTLISDNIFFKSDLLLGINGTIDRTLNLPIKLSLRDCVPGEILLEDHTCFACLKGTYLFDDPMAPEANKKCNICPENAYCQGGNHISPWKGYWRNSKNSSMIISCPTSESCLGIGENILKMMNLSNLTEEQMIRGVCHENYWGNLCYNCRKGYGRAKTNDVCEECSTLWIVYTKMVLSMIFVIIYVAVQAKIFSQIDRKDHGVAILMKLLLNHFQTISMISLVELGWTLDFNWYFSLQDYFSFLTEDFFIIDCLVQNIDQNLLVQKIIFTILLPIILSMIMITVWLVIFGVLLRKKKQQENLKIIKFLSKRMRITLLILVFILYPEILRKSFSLLNCLSIDDSYEYNVLSLSPNIECWAGDHNLWVLTVSLPGLLVWGILSPLLILIIMYKFKEKIQFYLYQTFSAVTSQKSFVTKKQSKTYYKKITIEIDDYVKGKLFGSSEIPPKHEIKYKKEDNIYLESTEIVCQNTEAIIREKNKKNKEPKNTEQEQECTHKFIFDPQTLSEYLDFLEKNINLNFNENELKEHPIHVKEMTQEMIEESNFVALEKIKAKKPVVETSENDKDMSRTAIVVSNLGFIYRGYKPEYYFWEIVMFSRKFFLIFIGIFTEFFPKKTKPTMLIIILVGYMYAQIKFNPYQYPYLNKLEALSLGVAFTTANIGILLFSDLLQNLSVLFLFIVFAINLFYVIFWLKCVYDFGHMKEKFAYFVICWRYMKGKIIACLK